LQTEKIVQQQAEITQSQDSLHLFERQRAELEGELEGLKTSIETRKAEAEREHRKRERLEKEIRELKSTMEQKALELKQKMLQITSSEEQQVILPVPLSHVANPHILELPAPRYAAGV
jgi:chromosome segregation ATPase